jgi:hypothetical protein
MVQGILAEVVLLVVQPHLWTVPPHVKVDQPLDLPTAAFDLLMGVAQLLDEQREELGGVLEVFVLLDEVL